MVLVLKKGAGKKQIQSVTNKLQNKKGVDTKKFCGVINLKEDPLQIQKEMRNEWK